MQPIQALEVDVTTIHDVKGARFRDQLIEDVDVVQFAVADVDKRGDIATQIEQRMHLHRRLGRAERCPREQRERQVDRSRVQGVRRVGQIDTEGFVDVQSAGDADQTLRKIGINPRNSRVAFALASVLRETWLRMPMW